MDFLTNSLAFLDSYLWAGGGLMMTSLLGLCLQLPPPPVLFLTDSLRDFSLG